VKKRASHSEMQVEFVEVDKIQIEGVYQREVLKSAKVQKIAANYSSEAFGTITLGRRADGSLWCVDGMHRLRAASKLKIKKVPATIFSSLGIQHEAQVFLKLNCERTAVSQVDVYRAALEAEEPDTLKIQEVLDSLSLCVSNSKSGATIRAASALRAIYKKGVLEKVLRTCCILLNSEAKMRKHAFCNTMLHMLAELYDEKNWHKDTPVCNKRLDSIISQLTYQEWRTIENSASGASGSRGLKLAIFFIEEHYNLRLRNNRVVRRQEEVK